MYTQMNAGPFPGGEEACNLYREVMTSVGSLEIEKCAVKVF